MVGGDDAGSLELVENRAHPFAAEPPARGEPDRQSILVGQPRVNLMIVGAQLQRAHVRIEMSRVDSRRKGLFDLRTQLRLSFVEAGMLVNLRDGLPQVPAGIYEGRHRIPAQYRSPFVAVPLGGEREMDAQVGVRIVPRVLRRLLEPRTRHEDRRRREQTFLQPPDDAFVLIVAHAEVVGIEDEHARIRRIAEAFRRRFCLVCHLVGPSNLSAHQGKKKGRLFGRPSLEVPIRRGC